MENSARFCPGKTVLTVHLVIIWSSLVNWTVCFQRRFAHWCIFQFNHVFALENLHVGYCYSILKCNVMYSSLQSTFFHSASWNVKDLKMLQSLGFTRLRKDDENAVVDKLVVPAYVSYLLFSLTWHCPIFVGFLKRSKFLDFKKPRVQLLFWICFSLLVQEQNQTEYVVSSAAFLAKRFQLCVTEQAMPGTAMAGVLSCVEVCGKAVHHHTVFRRLDTKQWPTLITSTCSVSTKKKIQSVYSVPAHVLKISLECKQYICLLVNK